MTIGENYPTARLIVHLKRRRDRRSTNLSVTESPRPVFSQFETCAALLPTFALSIVYVAGWVIAESR
jgi:hypothetical protein